MFDIWKAARQIHISHMMLVGTEKGKLVPVPLLESLAEKSKQTDRFLGGIISRFQVVNQRKRKQAEGNVIHAFF